MSNISQFLAAAAMLFVAEHATADEWRSWPGDARLGMQFQVLMPGDPLVVAWRRPEGSADGPTWRGIDIVQVDCEVSMWRFVRGQVFRAGAVDRSLTDRENWEPIPTHENSGSGKLMRGLCNGEILIPRDPPW
jgi:hypothetical protein